MIRWTKYEINQSFFEYLQNMSFHEKFSHKLIISTFFLKRFDIAPNEKYQKYEKGINAIRMFLTKSIIIKKKIAFARFQKNILHVFTIDSCSIKIEKCGIILIFFLQHVEQSILYVIYFYKLLE